MYGYANNPENSTVAGNVDVCLMPGTDKAESASVTGGGGFGVLSTSKYPEYAYKYIELFTSEDIQKYAYENYNVLPTIDALYKDENLVAEHEELAKFYPQFATAHPRPQLADYSEWSNTVQPLFSAALSGSTSIEDALNQAEEVSESFVN